MQAEGQIVSWTWTCSLQFYCVCVCTQHQSCK